MILGAGMVLVLLGSIVLLPIWPFSRAWGYTPSAVAGMLLLGLIGLVQIGVAS